ncbi:MAG: RidA family protein [Chloroflexi bacterium]|nr:RidA family protein [Chloroflexota bacterium]
MPNQVIKPAEVHVPAGRGYNHAVKAGNTVYVAGQVAIDKNGNLVGKGDFTAQAEQVYENLQAVLAAAGASFKDVVKMNTYLTRQEDLGKLREIRQRYATVEPPASTLLVISALANPDFLLEVEVIAVLS